MIITRRGFLGAILAAGAAPAIVRAESIMRINPRLIAPAIDIITPKGLFVGNGWRPGPENGFGNVTSVAAWVKEPGGQWQHRFWSRSSKDEPFLPPSILRLDDLSPVMISHLRTWRQID